MINRVRKLSIVRQAKLLGLSRGSVNICRVLCPTVILP